MPEYSNIHTTKKESNQNYPLGWAQEDMPQHATAYPNLFIVVSLFDLCLILVFLLFLFYFYYYIGCFNRSLKTFYLFYCISRLFSKYILKSCQLFLCSLTKAIFLPKKTPEFYSIKEVEIIFVTLTLIFCKMLSIIIDIFFLHVLYSKGQHLLKTLWSFFDFCLCVLRLFCVVF